jgi:hypothetical protein
MLCVSDCVHDGIRPGVPQATEWQRIGNQIGSVLMNYDFAQRMMARLFSFITGCLWCPWRHRR